MTTPHHAPKAARTMLAVLLLGSLSTGCGAVARRARSTAIAGLVERCVREPLPATEDKITATAADGYRLKMIRRTFEGQGAARGLCKLVGATGGQLQDYDEAYLVLLVTRALHPAELLYRGDASLGGKTRLFLDDGGSVLSLDEHFTGKSDLGNAGPRTLSGTIELRYTGPPDQAPLSWFRARREAPEFHERLAPHVALEEQRLGPRRSR